MNSPKNDINDEKQFKILKTKLSAQQQALKSAIQRFKDLPGLLGTQPEEEIQRHLKNINTLRNEAFQTLWKFKEASRLRKELVISRKRLAQLSFDKADSVELDAQWMHSNVLASRLHKTLFSSLPTDLSDEATSTSSSSATPDTPSSTQQRLIRRLRDVGRPSERHSAEQNLYNFREVLPQLIELGSARTPSNELSMVDDPIGYVDDNDSDAPDTVPRRITVRTGAVNAESYWRRAHHRFEISQTSERMIEHNPLSYHNLPIAIYDSYVETWPASNFRFVPENVSLLNMDDMTNLAFDHISRRIRTQAAEFYEEAQLSLLGVAERRERLLTRRRFKALTDVRSNTLQQFTPDPTATAAGANAPSGLAAAATAAGAAPSKSAGAGVSMPSLKRFDVGYPDPPRKGVPSSGVIFPRPPYGYLAPRSARQPAPKSEAPTARVPTVRTNAATEASSDTSARSQQSEVPAEAAILDSAGPVEEEEEEKEEALEDVPEGPPAGEQQEPAITEEEEAAALATGADAEALAPGVPNEQQPPASAQDPQTQPATLSASRESTAKSAIIASSTAKRSRPEAAGRNGNARRPQYSLGDGVGVGVGVDDGVPRRVLNSMRTPEQKNLRQETAPSSQVVERILLERFRKEHANTPDAAAKWKPTIKSKIRSFAGFNSKKKSMSGDAGNLFERAASKKPADFRNARPNIHPLLHPGLRLERVKEIVRLHLNSAIVEDRRVAARELGLLGLLDAMAVHALKERLAGDEDARVRYECARSLVLVAVHEQDLAIVDACVLREIVDALALALNPSSETLRLDVLEALAGEQPVDSAQERAARVGPALQPALVFSRAGAELQRLIATLYELVERGDRALSAADRDSDSASDSTPSTSRSSSKSQSHAVASGGSDLRAARREEQVQVALQAAACIARVQADSDAHSAMLERTGAFLLHALETLSDQQSIAITLRTLIARICYEGERIGEVLSRTLQMLRDSPVWQHRLLAAQLLALSGLEGNAASLKERVFCELQLRLSDEPMHSVRHEVAKSLLRLGLFDRACSDAVKRIDSTAESDRIAGVRAVGALGIKNQVVLRQLHEMLRFDSSDSVKLEIVRALAGYPRTDRKATEALTDAASREDVIGRYIESA